MKKLLLVGIIIIMVGMNISSSISKPMTIRNVITVDNEGDGDYTSIKEALDNANPGDKIEVYSGTYNEHTIVIETENITLEGIPYELGNGSDTGKPFVDGPGTDEYTLIAVKAPGVTIDGFRIKNYHGGGTGNCCITLYHNASRCVISNNDISHTLTALIWVDGSNNKILNNNISHSVMRQGIVLNDPQCVNCLVSGNVISDCDTGILLWDSHHHTITGNRIMRCEDFGIDVMGSHNIITGNHIEDNHIGLELFFYFNKVKYNNFVNNDLNAQFIYGYPLLLNLATTRWSRNYWDDWIGFGPKKIPGMFYFFPIVQFDWHPAQAPYDIGV